jgi:nucleotide-binding universal stress UspA family protein
MGLLLRAPRPRHVPRAIGYRQILVPLADDATSQAAVDLACRLAADKGATIRVLTVVEVPELLPLDAHMTEEELTAHALLQRAHAIAGSYGVRIVTDTIRAREAASVITEQARTSGSDLVVIGNASRRRNGARAVQLGQTADYVLKHVTCRVMLVREAPGAPAQTRA